MCVDSIFYANTDCYSKVNTELEVRREVGTPNTSEIKPTLARHEVLTPYTPISSSSSDWSLLDGVPPPENDVPV